MGKMITADDVEVGLLVTISDVKLTPLSRLVRGGEGEFPDGESGYQEEQRLSTTLQGLVGTPIRIVSVDLPFLVGKAFTRVLDPAIPGKASKGEPLCLDFRKVSLMKVSEEYAKWFPGAVNTPAKETTNAHRTVDEGPARSSS